MYENGLLIYNDKAGNRDARNNVGIAAGILSSNIKELTIVKGEAPGDLERICQERGSLFKLLIIMGGDGTVHECVNGLAHLDNPPQVAILPTGTCNDFARSLNISMELSGACVDALHGRAKKVDIGRVNDRYFTNFVGIGLITDASENIEDGVKERLGAISYFISAVKTMRETPLFHYRIKTDREEIDGDAVMIVVMNGKFIGTTALPYDNISVDDNKKNLIIVKEAGLPLFREWLQSKTFIGKNEKESDIIQREVERLTIETSWEMKADTDGEVYLKTPLEISNLPGKLIFKTGFQP